MSIANNPPNHRPHLLVLGAGFAGLRFCQTIPHGLARITVIDRQNHHLFQPLLYQVATAGLSAPDIAQPIRSILNNHPDITVRLGEASRIDLAARRVHLAAETYLDYDYLVIALGGVTSYFGHEAEWEPHAPGLKSLDDALRIRHQILLAYEQAENETDPAQHAELLTTVVIGAGPTGVELAGSFAELARTVLRHDFDHIDPTQAKVILIEGGPRVLSAFTEKLSASAQRQLAGLGVEVRTSTRVEAIREHEVALVGGETIRAANIIWAAGVAAHPITRTLGVELDRAGRIKVAPDLSVPGHPEVFALGDIVALTDRNGVVVPGVSPAAMQMGAHAAKLIVAEIKAHVKQQPTRSQVGPDLGQAGTMPKLVEASDLPATPNRLDQGRALQEAKGTATPAREPFAYWDKGSMATIGRSRAVAMAGRLQFSGWLAWMAWLLIHLVFLVGFRNRLSVITHWVYNYFTYKRGARLITRAGG